MLRFVPAWLQKFKDTDIIETCFNSPINIAEKFQEKSMNLPFRGSKNRILLRH